MTSIASSCSTRPDWSARQAQRTWRTPIFSLGATIILLGSLAAPETAAAATFTFPGPGCNTTLQACINGAAAGSTIRVAADSVDEEIAISKSITLTRAPGATPTIGGITPRDLVIQSPNDKRINVVLSKLHFENMNLSVDVAAGRGNSFKLLDSVVVGRDDASNGSIGVSIYASGTSSLNAEIADSTITADGAPLEMSTDTSFGTSSFNVHGNDISALNPSNSGMGIAFYANGSGVVEGRIHSNVVHDVASCGCGSPGVIRIRVDDSSDASISVANNTVDDAPIANGIRFTTASPTEMVRADLYVFNNTISNTSMGIAAPAYDPDVTFLNGYNNLFANSNPSSFGDYGEGPGTMSSNPLFVDETGGNYRLQSTSPLRNAGRYLVPGGTSAKDAANKARVSEGTVDVGAYESNSRKGCTIIGTAGADVLQGTSSADVICGDGGDDRIFGRGGNDRILGGPDKDRLWGNSGSDALLGGDAADKLDARDGIKGNDKMSGQAGPDGCKGDLRDTKKSC